MLRFCILILMLWPIVSTAQNYLVFRYSESEGLPSNEVRDVIRDSADYRWISTDAGVVRFDGNRFDYFDYLIPSKYTRGFTSTGGKLLVSHDAGLSEIDLSTLEVSLRSKDSSKESTLVYPDQLLAMESGEVWVGQIGGRVARFRGGVERSYQLHQSENREAIKVHIVQADEGEVWVGLSTGSLFRYNREKDEFELEGTFSMINDIIADGHSLWIAGEGLYHVDRLSSALRINQNRAIGNQMISAIARTEEGDMLLGIDHAGLYLVDMNNQSAVPTKIFANNDPHRIEELPFRTFNKIIPDGESVWLCTGQGLGLLRRRFFEIVQNVPTSSISSLAVRNSDERYVNAGQLFVAKSNSSGFEGIRSSFTGVDGILGGMDVDKYGQLWFGTSTGKLYRKGHAGTGLIADLSNRGGGIYYIYEDLFDKKWICQAPSNKPIAGLMCLDEHGVLKEYGPAKGLTNRVLSVKESPNGSLYASGIGKNSYLFRFFRTRDEFLNLSVPFDFYVSPNFEVHDLAIDKRGIIWLGTTDGLLRQEGDRVFQVDLGPGYDDVEIRSLTVMADGSLWLGTDTRGLIYHVEDEFLGIGEESGLPSKLMSYRCLKTDEDGRLWVGTQEGSVYSLHALPKPRSTPTPELAYANKIENNDVASNIRIRTSDVFHVNASTPSFHGYRTFYEYRLNNGDWKRSEPMHEIELKNLSKGFYRMQVRARREGPWFWSEPKVLALRVHEAWYKSKAFIYLFVISLFGGLLTWFLIKRNTYKRKIQILEEELDIEKATSSVL